MSASTRDLLASACLAGLPAHGGQLRPIAADTGHVMGDDQMVLGIDGDLRIVADNASALTAGRHRTGIEIGPGDLFVGRGLNLVANLPEGLHLPPQELCRKIGDGVNQAADLISATASIPSLNFIPLTTSATGFDLAIVARSWTRPSPV